jgi:hypothetical protein
MVLNWNILIFSGSLAFQTDIIHLFSKPENRISLYKDAVVKFPFLSRHHLTESGKLDRDVSSTTEKRPTHSCSCKSSKLRLKVRLIIPLFRVLKTDHSFLLQILNKFGKATHIAQFPTHTSNQTLPSCHFQ